MYICGIDQIKYIFIGCGIYMCDVLYTINNVSTTALMHNLNIIEVSSWVVLLLMLMLVVKNFRGKKQQKYKIQNSTQIWILLRNSRKPNCPVSTVWEREPLPLSVCLFFRRRVCAQKVVGRASAACLDCCWNIERVHCSIQDYKLHERKTRDGKIVRVHAVKKGVKASRRTQPACYSFNDRISSPCVCALAERKTFCTAAQCSFRTHLSTPAIIFCVQDGERERKMRFFQRKVSWAISLVKLTLSPF